MAMRRTIFRVEIEQLQRSRLFERPLEVPQFTIDLQRGVKVSTMLWDEETRMEEKMQTALETDFGDDGLVRETLADAEGDLEGGGLPAGGLLDSAVGESNRDGFSRFCGDSGGLLSEKLVEHLDPAVDVRWRRVELERGHSSDQIPLGLLLLLFSSGLSVLALRRSGSGVDDRRGSGSRSGGGGSVAHSEGGRKESARFRRGWAAERGGGELL